mmetsp:Transcript_34557/g.69806  ORF Transcript_34557/g.69806 Transcript_34557/m.69806 type:complete len:187 (-) Transcript_34557:506-1066(-)
MPSFPYRRRSASSAASQRHQRQSLHVLYFERLNKAGRYTLPRDLANDTIVSSPRASKGHIIRSSGTKGKRSRSSRVLPVPPTCTGTLVTTLWPGGRTPTQYRVRGQTVRPPSSIPLTASTFIRARKYVPDLCSHRFKKLQEQNTWNTAQNVLFSISTSQERVGHGEEGMGSVGGRAETSLEWKGLP